MREGARDCSLKNFKKVLSKREENFKKVLSKRGVPLIRHAKKEDFNALLSLEKICFKEETFSKKQLGYLFFRAKSIVLVAALEGEVVGSMIILLRERISHARIYSLNVHPQWRRVGIGGLLMDTALRLLKEKGFRKLSLEVGVNNMAAQNLYRQNGFAVDKPLRSYYKDGGDAFHLVRKL